MNITPVKKMLLMIFGVILFVVVVGLITRANRGETTVFSSLFNRQGNLVGQTMKKMVIGTHQLDVAIADTDAKKQKGLGGVISLTDSQGMLFDFSKENMRPTFWMKDMKIAIDIIWIKAGRIVQIDKSVQPPAPGTTDVSLKLYAPKETVDYVLEVNAGWADRNSVLVGDSVIVP
jgi:uncharacterized membrane protein (UPF0127 family)